MGKMTYPDGRSLWHPPCTLLQTSQVPSPAGSVYIGSWKNGERSGDGVLTTGEGEKYKGQWERDCQHGQVKLIRDQM